MGTRLRYSMRWRAVVYFALAMGILLYLKFYYETLFGYQVVPATTTVETTKTPMTTINWNTPTIKWEYYEQSGEVRLKEDQPKLCVIVRTYESQEQMVIQTLFSLTSSPTFYNLKLILVDTTTYLRLPYLDQILKIFEKDPRISVSPRMLNKEVPPKAQDTSGYEDTNAEIQRLLEQGGCDYFLFTNGDNVYGYELFNRTLPWMLEKKIWIYFGFATHHQGYIKRNDGGIDLGSAFIKASVIADNNMRFEPYNVMNRVGMPYHDSDMLFFHHLRNFAGSSIVSLSDEVHFFHL